MWLFRGNASFNLKIKIVLISFLPLNISIKNSNYVLNRNKMTIQNH